MNNLSDKMDQIIQYQQSSTTKETKEEPKKEPKKRNKKRNKRK